MNDILVLYASTHGHTAKIASRVADVIERAGATVDLRSVRGSAAVASSA